MGYLKVVATIVEYIPEIIMWTIIAAWIGLIILFGFAMITNYQSAIVYIIILFLIFGMIYLLIKYVI